MDDVSLKQKQTDDKELDNLIFSGENEEDVPSKENEPQPRPQTLTVTHESDSDDSDETKSTASTKSGDRSSLNNVLPVDKLKNGANTASKCVQELFTFLSYFIFDKN